MVRSRMKHKAKSRTVNTNPFSEFSNECEDIYTKKDGKPLAKPQPKPESECDTRNPGNDKCCICRKAYEDCSCVDNQIEGKPKPEGECCTDDPLECPALKKFESNPKPEEDTVFNGEIAKQVTRYRLALEAIIATDTSYQESCECLMCAMKRIAKKALGDK